MTVNRTTLLDLPLPVTGTEAGTWGDTTNNGLSQYMDIAIAGMNSLTSANFTAGALTIANTQGDSSATNIAAGSAQYATIRVSSLAVNSTITAPGSNRSYRIINADSTYSLTIKASGQTGVTFLPGQTGVVAFNGTDYVIVGVVGAGTATDNAVARFDGTTGKLVQNSVVTIADSTGDVAGVGALTASGNLTLSGGTANGVAYLNGSKVVTTGSALTFDGTDVGIGGAPVTGLPLRLLRTSSGAQIRYQNTAATWDSGVTSAGAYEIFSAANTSIQFGVNSSEQMRLTSTGLGIGTSSPSQKLTVDGNIRSSGNIVTGVSNVNSSVSVFSTVASGGSGFSEILLGNATSATAGFLSYSHASNSLLIGTNSATRATLDSSGNLGLGVTPSAWGSSSDYKAIQIGGAQYSFLAANLTQYIYGNAYFDGTNNRYINSLPACSFGVNVSGGYQWNIAPSGTAGNAISFTQAMTLDASGNLLIGDTTGVSAQTRIYAKIPVVPVNTTYEAVRVTDNTSADFKVKLTAGASTGVVNGVCILNTAAYNMAFETVNTERARIDSSGNLLVGTTTNTLVSGSASKMNIVYPGGSALYGIALRPDTDTTTAITFCKADGTAIVGSISQTASATAYNTSSDYRLKDNQAPLTGSGAFIDALKPKTWNWKADGSRGVGFIAHEVQEVSPCSVVGEKDGEQMQAMEYGSAEFIANIIAELQSLRTRVAALESN